MKAGVHKGTIPGAKQKSTLGPRSLHAPGSPHTSSVLDVPLEGARPFLRRAAVTACCTSPILQSLSTLKLGCRLRQPYDFLAGGCKPKTPAKSPNNASEPPSSRPSQLFKLRPIKLLESCLTGP